MLVSDDIAYRVDPTALFAASRRVRSRGVLFVALGAPLLLLGLILAFGMVIALFAHSFAESQGGEKLAAALILGFCFLPLLGAIALLVVGARRLSRGASLRDLSSLSHGSAQVTVLGLSARTGKSPGEIMALLAIGRAHGAATREGAAKVPSAPVDATKLKDVARSLLLRGVASALAAFPVAIFTIITTILIFVGFWGEGDWKTQLTGVIVFIGGSVAPSALTVLLFVRARRNLRERDRLQALAAALGSGARTFEALGAAIKLPPVDVEKALEDAMERRGLFVPRPFATTPGQTPLNTPSGAPPGGPHPSWIGRTIRGSYYIEAPLGHGGMGVVFRARHLATGATCALKLLVLSRYDSPDVLKRFEREATLSRGLAHPGLVRVDDFGTAEDGTPFIAMELLVGETLEEKLARQGVLAWHEARNVAFAVGDALAAAHGAGFLHRDVKPSNIMLAQSPRGERPVLVDFGLAKRLDTSARSKVTTTGAVIGTPLYMSPEQARGEPLDERSDLYGLAVVVYEMLAGVPPFFDKTLAEVYARLLKEAPPHLSERAPGRSSPALDAVLARAMATRREDRYRTVGEWLQAMHQVG